MVQNICTLVNELTTLRSRSRRRQRPPSIGRFLPMSRDVYQVDRPLWKTHESLPRTRYGVEPEREYHQRDNPHCPELGPINDKLLTAVLDGQQRLTAFNVTCVNCPRRASTPWLATRRASSGSTKTTRRQSTSTSSPDPSASTSMSTTASSWPDAYSRIVVYLKDHDYQEPPL